MPIKIPRELPAYEALSSEHIFLMTETRRISGYKTAKGRYNQFNAYHIGYGDPTFKASGQ